MKTYLLPAVAADTAAERREAVTARSRERYAAGQDEPQRPTEPVLEGAAAPVAEPEPRRARAMSPTPPPSPAPARERRPSPAAPVSLGRGGPEHQYLQELVKRWAEAKGYRATVEEPIPGGGQVDVALRREGHTLACEISVTTGAEHEAGNIMKCLSAGFDEVVLLSLQRGTLGKVSKAVFAAVAEADRGRLHFLSPEELITMLDAPTPEGYETTVGGYKVKVKYRAVSAEEAARKQRAVANIVLKSLRRMKKDGA